MNLDFILFTPPKVKYSFLDFWGEVIFIPKFSKYQPKQDQKSLLSSIFSCYTNTKTTESSLTVDSALLDVKGFYAQIQQAVTEENTELNNQAEQIVQKYIPCLYLDSMVNSEYLLLYFHSSGQDIKLAHGMMNHLRNSYQMNVVAMQYPGYSINKGKTSSIIINQDAKIVYQYLIEKLGFKEDKIIVMGRSIGTGVALELMQGINPAAIVLISPFTNIKSLAKEFIGKFGYFLAKQTYDNLANIRIVKCPIFILHGQKDDLISIQNSQQLSKNCSANVRKNYPANMTHSAFDYYCDLSDPLRQFLMQEGINFYKQGMKGPQIPDQLFKCPQSMNLQ